MNTKSTKRIKEVMTKKKVKGAPKFLSTGAPTLNIGCSGRIRGGFPMGCVILLVGDSSSGKSFLSMTCLAEASIDVTFDDYEFHVFDVEHGIQMNIARYFGERTENRIVWHHPESLEEMYTTLAKLRKAEKKYIAIVDSMDALDAKADLKKLEKELDGDEEKGSYGMAKAKKNSEHLRRVRSYCGKSGSLFICISQTRDNVGFGAQFNPKTRSGGRAMKFYADLEIWTDIVGSVTRTIKGKKRKVGILARCSIKKNRVQGKESQVVIPLHYSSGIDYIGSCIYFLIDEGHWTDKKGVVSAPEFDFKGKQESLVKHIEQEGLERDLEMIVADCWEEIEKKCVVERKSRYA